MNATPLQNGDDIGARADTVTEVAYRSIDAPMFVRIVSPSGGPVGLCTDSNALLPTGLAERFGVEVVPLTIVIGEHEYLDGVDLTADEYYDMFRDGRPPSTTWSKPSAGQFAAAYDDLAARGCSQILSIHSSLGDCSVLHAARLGAHASSVPVRLVDSGIARFGISCSVWAAGQALAAGASVDEAATAAETLSPAVGNVFIVSGLALATGGTDAVRRHRLDRGDDPRPAVLSVVDGAVEVVRRVDTMVDAVNVMAQHTLQWGDHLNVAVGTAHRDTEPIAQALAHAVGESANVREVMPYRIGPSVGVHTGPGTVSCVMFPAAPA